MSCSKGVASLGYCGRRRGCRRRTRWRNAVADRRTARTRPAALATPDAPNLFVGCGSRDVVFDARLPAWTAHGSLARETCAAAVEDVRECLCRASLLPG